MRNEIKDEKEGGKVEEESLKRTMKNEQMCEKREKEREKKWIFDYQAHMWHNEH